MQTAKRNTRLILLIILLLGAGGIALTFLFPSIFGEPIIKTNFVKAPTSKAVLSSTDGKKHAVIAKFAIEVDEKDKPKIDTKTISSEISSILEQLDYEKIIDANGVAYLKQEVLNRLANNESGQKVKGVYLDDLLTGGESLYNAAPEEQESVNGNDMFKGLFKNAK